MQDAQILCNRILAIQPKHVDALGMLGVASAQTGNYTVAIRALSKSVSLNPANAMLHSNLGQALVKAGKHEEALEHFLTAVNLADTHAPAHYDLGCMLRRLNRMEEAIISFERALLLAPGSPEILSNLGAALRQQARHREAINSLEKALEVKPEFLEALVNIGVTHQELGNLDCAMKYLDQAVEVDPTDADAHMNLAICYLLKGELSRGWQEYQWRWKQSDKLQRSFNLPEWDGTDLQEKKLLVYAEQGIGDEIMFASCIPELVTHSRQVMLDCEPRLAPLFQRSFPQVKVHGQYQNEDSTWLEEVGGADVKVATGTLPRFLRPNLNRFPGHAGFLIADEKFRLRWQSRLDELDGTKVGISWEGGGTALGSCIRSIPLDMWQPLFDIPGLSFINLQYGECQEQLDAVMSRTGTRIWDWPDSDPLKDLDDFAAQIASLDLVISIDNSTAHLAGALGVPTWTLLPHTPDWRWMLERRDSPWYPSMRLYRQPEQGDWRAVISAVTEDLSRQQ